MLKLPISKFEFLVALRYLRTRRKEKVISVITLISILGVMAGVAALVIALAINNGFRTALQKNLLGATAHVMIQEKEPGFGIENWRTLVARIRNLPHVVDVEPSLYGSVFLAGPIQGEGAILKGIWLEGEPKVSDFLQNLKEGSLEPLRNPTPNDLPGIILGVRLARRTGMRLHSVVKVISPQGELTPFGPRPSYYNFRVVGIFESGFYDLDSAWAFVTLKQAQRILSLNDVVNAIELKIDDIYRAPEVAAQLQQVLGEELIATHWMEQNKQILSALRMERLVSVITIGLIVLVGALNILITLVMIVMEKYKEVAILLSLGARRQQIRRIFVLQGLLIGAAGTTIGLLLGYLLSYLADRYKWVRLEESVYAFGYVPFEPRWLDAFWIAAAAMLISYLATLYPASNATRIAPAETLRYE